MDNKLYYATKRDINGNRYHLIIDLINRTGACGYNLRFYGSEYNQVTKKALHNIRDTYEAAGFLIECK